MPVNIDWAGSWAAVNTYLADNPFVERVAFSLLPFLVLLIKTVREWLKAQIASAWCWLRDQILCAHMFPFLGLVTKQELDRALTESQSAHSKTQAQPRTVERWGVKIQLAKNIKDYLGKIDETHLDPDKLIRSYWVPIVLTASIFLFIKVAEQCSSNARLVDRPTQFLA